MRILYHFPYIFSFQRQKNVRHLVPLPDRRVPLLET